jgi:cytochrome c oxidase subunit 2
MSDQTHETEHSPKTGGHSVDPQLTDDPMQVSVGMTVVFIAAITLAALSFGISVPGATARINPATLNDPGSPFATPGLRELAPGKYEAYMVAQTWNFLPDKLEVPVGAEVTFYITARDVVHGIKIAGTNVNMMALPGQVSTLRATFDTPGTYNYICHEYCGYVAGAPIGHHTMYGQITVLPADETAQVTTE